MTDQEFRAIETVNAIRQAVKHLRAKFSEGAEPLKGLGPNTFWHEQLGLWGHIEQWIAADGAYRHWNVFGSVPFQLRKNIIVEINPPLVSKDKQSQGVIALAPNGERWLLHRGRMSIPGSGISEDQFDQVSKGARVAVSFADGSESWYHPVANLEVHYSLLQSQLASFVAKCRMVRIYHSLGKEAAQQEANLEEAVLGISPELVGSYRVAPQAGKLALRRHGDVWHALAECLAVQGIKHTNSRIQGWGPDLRTIGSKPVLFEIKVSLDASDVQRAVGQLYLYEKLLKKVHRKVLVLPGALNPKLSRALDSLNVELLTFSAKGKAITFDKKDIASLLS
ncbi:hypothetical protein AB7714_19840 [Tardiphaga sp. 1201_B9_N1_1]|uniref:hypothetical protein n=1 Tax=unclassified Tardiphaga TaxID=2631404 RepID=UPI003F2924BA